jgi:transcription elongation GreA/GreB family factor
LPPGQPEDFGEAVLVEKIESAAKADPEIRAAVEALGNDVQEAAKVNPELEKAIRDLTEVVKAQKITNIAKNNTGNVAVGGSVSIQAENFTQNF